MEIVWINNGFPFFLGVGDTRRKIFWLKLCFLFFLPNENFQNEKTCSNFGVFKFEVELCWGWKRRYKETHFSGLKFSSSFHYIKLCSFNYSRALCIAPGNVVCSIKMRFAYIFATARKKISSSCTFEVNAFAIPTDVSFLTANDFFILNFLYVFPRKQKHWGWKISWKINVK